MFRTSYVHHQEDFMVHANLYGMLSMQAIYEVEAHPSTWQIACVHA